MGMVNDIKPEYKHSILRKLTGDEDLEECIKEFANEIIDDASEYAKINDISEKMRVNSLELIITTEIDDDGTKYTGGEIVKLWYKPEKENKK